MVNPPLRGFKLRFAQREGRACRGRGAKIKSPLRGFKLRVVQREGRACRGRRGRTDAQERVPPIVWQFIFHVHGPWTVR